MPKSSTSNLSLSSGNQKMKSQSYLTKDPIKFLCILISITFAFIICLSVLKLHKIPVTTTSNYSVNSSTKARIGKLGKMVIEMLPEDMGFTLFLPSDKAFERDLGLGPNDLVGEKRNDTYVILTRVMGFSAVPRMIDSVDVRVGKEIDYDSLSGYMLYVSKDFDGMLRVNGIGSKMVDLRSGKIVVHVMDGVIMDSEFEQSVRPGVDEDD